jgi:gliding motility-associated-like protein
VRKGIVVLLFIACCQCLLVGQSEIYISDATLSISVVGIESGSCSLTRVVTTDRSLSDITLHPNGRMYGCNFSNRTIYEVDLVTWQTSPVLQIAEANRLVGMTADSEGLLYVTEGEVVPSDLYVVDPVSGTYVNKGPLADGSAGDLTWSFGKLYNASDNNKLVEVNVDDPAGSTVIGSFTGVVRPGDRIFALVSVFTSCVETQTFALSELGDYYALDLETAAVQRLCIGSVSLYGSTSQDEFLASECIIGLDLDGDNSSGLAGSDFLSEFDCGARSAPVGDLDVVVQVSTRVDSLHVWLGGGPPAPSADEFLEFDPVPGLVVSGTGQFLSAVSDGAGTAEAEQFLAGVAYRDTGQSPTTDRVVYSAVWSEGRSDTAMTVFRFTRPDAGADGFAEFCPGEAPRNLFNFLGGMPEAGGTWSPDLSGGNGIFDPAVDAAGTYAYTLDNGCFTDTSFVTVSYADGGTIALDIGNDTTICLGACVTFSSGLSPVRYDHEWSTGSTNNTITTSSPGVYVLEVSSLCQYGSDTVEVTVEDCDTLVTDPPDTTGGPVDTTGVVEPAESCTPALPTAFSPNGDSYNEVFGLAGRCPWLAEYDLRVYNRYGEEMFRGDETAYWDGNFKGEAAPADVYIWQLNAWHSVEGWLSWRGTVAVIR